MVKRSLAEHKYHIIAEKSVQMSEAIAQQFITSCQKITI
jgi:hypothetical protein